MATKTKQEIQELIARYRACHKALDQSLMWKWPVGGDTVYSEAADVIEQLFNEVKQYQKQAIYSQ